MNPRCHSVTPEMIEAGAAEILSEVGGAPLAVFFDPRELAVSVYWAMDRQKPKRS